LAKKCREGAGLQRVRLPPGNWLIPPSGSESFNPRLDFNNNGMPLRSSTITSNAYRLDRRTSTPATKPNYLKLPSAQWLVTDQQFDLLQICPSVALGKYIAITSFDSGPLVPTNGERGRLVGRAGAILQAGTFSTIRLLTTVSR
jgi:hypothetical protein